MAKPNQRTVKIQKTNNAGVTMVQEIHERKWQAGRKFKGIGNAFERAGWELVKEKTASAPKEVKTAKPENVDVA